MFKSFLSGFAVAALMMTPALAHQGDVTSGNALYKQDCSSCHLASGAGGVHFGQAVSADLRAPGLEKTYHHSTKLLMRAILHARDQSDQPLDRPMPAWQGQLSQAQVLNIIAYLKTLHS